MNDQNLGIVVTRRHRFGLFWSMTAAILGMVCFVAVETPPLDAAPTVAVPQVDAGDRHTCVLDSGSVKCWGLNSGGQLGLGDIDNRGDAAGEMGDALLVVDLGSGVKATAIAAGGSHTCALLSTGGVKCWGRNRYGQLGLGDTENRGDAAGEMGAALPVVDLGSGVTATAIGAGQYFTCALLSTGGVKCWGRNRYGQLGLGDTDSRGDAAGEMGDALPVVDLGSGLTASKISVGEYHVCVVLSTGGVKCWGDNGSGTLGLGDIDNRGDAAGEMGDALPAVDLGAGLTVADLDTGGAHTCASSTNGSVKCWGANALGQLGLGDTNNRGDDAGEMGDALPAVDLGSTMANPSLELGDFHSCAFSATGTVKCWGGNNRGQLGLGDTNSRGDAVGEMGDALSIVDLGSGVVVIGLASDTDHTCSLSSVGAVKCWGRNDTGQLGVGDTDDRGDNAGEMGDSLAIAIQVSRAVQSITFDAITDRVLAASKFTVTATSDWSLVVTLTSGTPEVCSVTGFEVAMLAIGECSLTASQGGAPSVLPAADAVRTFRILPLPSLKKGRNATLASMARSGLLSVPARAKVTGSINRLSRSVCKVSGSKLVGLAPGRCLVKIKVAPKSGPASTATMSVNVLGSPQLKKGKSVKLVDAAAAAGLITGEGVSLAAVVEPSSAKRCKASGARVVATKTGKCVVVVTAQTAAGATLNKSLSFRIS